MRMNIPSTGDVEGELADGDGHAVNTEVTETEQDDQDVDPASVEVSMADAIEAASADQDGMVTEVSLDDEDGLAVWQVEFDDEIDVDVDASSGDVIGVDR